MTFIIVLLPAPFGPITPTRSPGATLSETPRSATSSSCSIRPWSLRIAYSLMDDTTSFATR